MNTDKYIWNIFRETRNKDIPLYYWKEKKIIQANFTMEKQLITNENQFDSILNKKIILISLKKKENEIEKYIEQMVLAESNYKLLFYNKVKE
jgi:hypothetical protein